MPKEAARRRILPVLLLALLAMPWAVSAASPQASPRTARAIQPEALDLLSQLWSFLTKIGCNIDPNGQCATKEGCGIDPSGCTSQSPQSQPKEGCNIDPNGRCSRAETPQTQPKEGCRIDPDGRCLP
jgi:hypothetical protein